MDSLQRLEANAKQIGKMVDWRTTQIGSTQGGRETDPWRELANYVSTSYGRGMGRSLSYARDAVMNSLEEVANGQLDINARGYLAGLKYYLSNLPRGARPRQQVVGPLMRGLLANWDVI